MRYVLGGEGLRREMWRVVPLDLKIAEASRSLQQAHTLVFLGELAGHGLVSGCHRGCVWGCVYG